MPFLGPQQRLAFSKFEGLGNDFLVIDLRSYGSAYLPAVSALSRLAPKLCDRRLGVGGDGLLLITVANQAKARAGMIVINADGSRPEMCGNGLRCVAHYLALGHSLQKSPSLQSDFWVHTDNGPLHCRVEGRGQELAQVQVAMGPAGFGAMQQPAAAPQREFVSVNMGNPHAIHWVGPDEDPEQLARRLGPGVETDSAYPDATNVEFVKDTPKALICWVWERGCGITHACGTGACATAAAAVRAGKRAPNEAILVRLPGGDLEIKVPADEQASLQMRGPSRWVFDGQLNLQREGLRG